LTQSKSPEGTRREGPPFPTNPWYKVSNFHHKILTPREKREELRTPGRGQREEQPLLFLREGKEKTGRERGRG